MKPFTKQMYNSEACKALLLSLMLSVAQGQSSVTNSSNGLTGFPPCDALIAANLTHITHLASSPLYPMLVNGSWTPETKRSPYCFVYPSTASEVSEALVALGNAGEGAGNWNVAVRSGGHGKDNQNSLTDGVIIDLTGLNTTTYDPTTTIAGLSTGSRWGQVYSDLQLHEVSVTGGRQSIVGVGGLLLGGGVGWTTPRTGFGCDSVVNFEVVLADGQIINANASSNSDLWLALKGGSSNFGIVTRFDVQTFPASNITLERRTVSEQYTDQFIDALVGYANLDQSYSGNAMVSVVSYQPSAGIIMTVTEVNTVNNWSTTAFDEYNKIPLLTPSNKQSYTLPDVAAIDAPELSLTSRSVGVGPGTIANNPQVVRYLFEQHAILVADLNATLGPQNFSTILEIQPLPTYFTDISVQKGGNMLGLERSRRNKIYYALGAMLSTPASVAQVPLVQQKVAAAVQRVIAYAKSVGANEELIYLPYADASQDALGSYGAANVEHIRQVAKQYDPKGFFQRRVTGGFKIDRVV